MKCGLCITVCVCVRMYVYETVRYSCFWLYICRFIGQNMFCVGTSSLATYMDKWTSQASEAKMLIVFNFYLNPNQRHFGCFPPPKCKISIWLYEIKCCYIFPLKSFLLVLNNLVVLQIRSDKPFWNCCTHTHTICFHEILMLMYKHDFCRKSGLHWLYSTRCQCDAERSNAERRLQMHIDYSNTVKWRHQTQTLKFPLSSDCECNACVQCVYWWRQRSLMLISAHKCAIKPWVVTIIFNSPHATVLHCTFSSTQCLEMVFRNICSRILCPKH